MKWRDARNSHLEQAYSSGPKVKTQADVKSLYSLKACPVTKAKKILVYCGQDEKDRHVILDIIPYVVGTSPETDAFMAIVVYFDMLMVTRNPARGRRRMYSWSSCYYVKKKRFKVVYLKTQIQWVAIFRKVEELGLNASAGHIWNSQDAPGTKLKFGKEKGNLEALSKRSHERNPHAFYWGPTTWGMYQQSSVEFGPKIKLVMDSGASMHIAE